MTLRDKVTEAQRRPTTRLRPRGEQGAGRECEVLGSAPPDFVHFMHSLVFPEHLGSAQARVGGSARTGTSWHADRLARLEAKPSQREQMEPGRQM